MKTRKKQGRKIRHKKINLYPKKRTKAQKIAGTVALAVIIIALMVLGYFLAPPLLEYLEQI